MLVDVHAHIGRAPGGTVLPEDAANYADTVGLDILLVSNRDAASEPCGAGNVDEVDANAACLEACRAFPRLVPLYWARVGAADSNVHVLRGALELEPFAGVVFSPCESSFDGDTPLLLPYLEALAAVRRPALFCIGGDARAAPSKVYEVARRGPRVPIVLCVCGGVAGQRAAALDVVGHALRSRAADLYLDTSYASAEDIRAAIEVIGVGRVLFGSDALSRPAGVGRPQLALLDELRKSLSAEDFEQVVGENAARLFRLPRTDNRPSGASPDYAPQRHIKKRQE